jgi:hypothetical protein
MKDAVGRRFFTSRSRAFVLLDDIEKNADSPDAVWKKNVTFFYVVD